MGVSPRQPSRASPRASIGLTATRGAPPGALSVPESDLAESPEAAGAVSRMIALLDAWVSAHLPVRSPETQENREDRTRLRALGYLQ